MIGYEQPAEECQEENDFTNGHVKECTGLAAVVPAHNEGGRIGKVLEVLRQVEGLAEIIVVDDGSSDGTSVEVSQVAARDNRVRIIRHYQNQGKGAALRTAWRAASDYPYLLMLDADLINLRPEHVQDLVAPVVAGELEMSVGVFRSGYWRTDTSHWLTPWLSGQRCLQTVRMAEISWDAAAGYGFETALTVAARRGGWRYRYLPMRGVSHPPGEVHRPGLLGPITRVRMYAEIVRAWIMLENWPRVVERAGRRARSILIVGFAFTTGLVNNCTMNPNSASYRWWLRYLSDDAVWKLWGQVKAAIDFLP